MLLWRASGERSRTSLSITVATRRENRLFGRSPNTSRYSTIGKDGKHGWGTYPRLTMNGSSMQGRLQHERKFGVHYCHQGSICLWFELEEYLVILAKRRGYVILWTAYLV